MTNEYRAPLGDIHDEPYTVGSFGSVIAVLKRIAHLLGGTITVNLTGTNIVRVTDGSDTLLMDSSGRPGVVIASDTLQDGVTALPIKFAVINASSSGDNQIVASVSSKKLRLISSKLISGGTVTAKWRSNTTDKSGPMPLVINSGWVDGFNPGGWLETAAGEALNLNLGGAVAVGGHVSYVEV